MKITLFGATGFIGSHVAEQLALAGFDVHCIVRNSSDTRLLHSFGVRITTSGFGDELAEQIEQGSTVINCIADTRLHISDDQRRQIEVGLTSQLFRAADTAKAERFIQLSTVMVYGFNRPATAIDESYPPSPLYSYNRIAWEREEALLRLAEKSLLPLAILRPSNTTGRRDISMLPNFLNTLKFRLFPTMGDGSWEFSCIDTRDIGRAMALLAESKPQTAEIFLVKGYDISWLQIKQALDNKLGRRSFCLPMPKAMMLWLGGAMESLFPFGKEPPLTRFSVEVLSNNTLFDDSKIRQLGFTPKYSLTDSVNDYFQNS